MLCTVRQVCGVQGWTAVICVTDWVHLHAAGSGRRVGETCEQTWAEVKPVTTLTRYMSKGHYLDCIDDAFFYLTLAKQRSFVLFMVQQHKSATKKLGECDKTV